jgi:hypothetical protein
MMRPQHQDYETQYDQAFPEQQERIVKHEGLQLEQIYVTKNK